MISWLENRLRGALALERLSQPRGLLRFVVTMTIGTTVVTMILRTLLLHVIVTSKLVHVPEFTFWSVGFPLTMFLAASLTALGSTIVGRAVLDLALARAESERLSQTDPLSGLLNRRAFNDAFAKTQVHSSLLVIDADNFKSINDRFGHDAGDSAILAISSVLTRAFVPPHVVARLGGEEFGVLLLGLKRPEAVLLAERVRRDIEAMVVICADATVRLTVSIGMDEFGPDDLRENVLRRADRALYQAKDSGRNRVVHCHDLDAGKDLAGQDVPVRLAG